MTLELGGQITVACEKTGYSAQLEFKLKVRLLVTVEIKAADIYCICLYLHILSTRLVLFFKNTFI